MVNQVPLSTGRAQTSAVLANVLRFTRRCGRVQVFAPHEYVYRAGETATSLYIVQAGLASTGFHIYGSKSYFGEVRHRCARRSSGGG
jgi:hypothetical protein